MRDAFGGTRAEDLSMTRISILRLKPWIQRSDRRLRCEAINDKNLNSEIETVLEDAPPDGADSLSMTRISILRLKLRHRFFLKRIWLMLSMTRISILRLKLCYFLIVFDPWLSYQWQESQFWDWNRRVVVVIVVRVLLSMTRISILRLKPPIDSAGMLSSRTINDKNLNSEIETELIGMCKQDIDEIYQWQESQFWDWNSYLKTNSQAITRLLSMTRISILRLKHDYRCTPAWFHRWLSMTRISILRLKLCWLPFGNGAMRSINDKNLNSEIETFASPVSSPTKSAYQWQESQFWDWNCDNKNILRYKTSGSINDKNLNSEIETATQLSDTKFLIDYQWQESQFWDWNIDDDMRDVASLIRAINDKNLNSEIETTKMVKFSASYCSAINDKNLNSEIETCSVIPPHKGLTSLSMTRISILRLKQE